MKTIFLVLAMSVCSLFAQEKVPAEKKGSVPQKTIAVPKKKNPGLRLTYIAWDHHMLGIESPQKRHRVSLLVKRNPTIAVVSYSGFNKSALKGVDIEYVSGPKRHRGMHDTYQISEVAQIALRLGVKVKFKVYQVTTSAEIAKALRLAGKDADIVITYSSYWNNIRIMQDAVAANPDTLYISPYVEVGPRKTNLSFQSGARHPDGTGLRNFVTVIPLCRHKPSGKLLVPLGRDKNDTETINFVAPSSYASSRGETCPSAGVAAVVAAYIASTSETKMTAEEIISIMLRNTSFPEERMLKLRDFNPQAVETLRSSLKSLKTPDAVGIRRLESDGVLDLWKIYEDLLKRKTAPAK